MNPTQLVSNPKKYYLVYQTTNIINNYIYIGVHSTNNLDDGYLGSGTLLKKAIIEFSKENFKREILYFCNSKQEMLDKEKEIVNSDFLKRKDVYNSIIGGGKFNIINCTDEIRQKIKSSRFGVKMPPRSELHKQKLSLVNTGKKRSSESKNKQRQTIKLTTPIKLKIKYKFNKIKRYLKNLIRKYKYQSRLIKKRSFKKSKKFIKSYSYKFKLLASKFKKLFKVLKKYFKKPYVVSNETRIKMSESRKGREISIETRQKISKSNSVSQRGKKLSEETKRKISEGLKNKPKPPRTKEHIENQVKSRKLKKMSSTTPVSSISSSFN